MEYLEKKKDGNRVAFPISRFAQRQRPGVFLAAKKANAIVITKEADFVHLVEQSGPPPQGILLTCGNTSNSHLREILKRTYVQTMEWIRKGEAVVEITGA